MIHLLLNFNSIKVQLKHNVRREDDEEFHVFQFHKGTIKTHHVVNILLLY